MTEPSTETASAAAEQEPEGNQPTPPENVAENGIPDEERGANSEAAKWRRKLRDAETQLTTLAERMDGIQRAEIERLAGHHLQDGADLWRDSSIEPDTLLGDDGRVDVTKVADAAKGVLAQHPHWQRRSPMTEPTSSVNGNGRVGEGKPAPTFADAFKPRDRRSS